MDISAKKTRPLLRSIFRSESSSRPARWESNSESESESQNGQKVLKLQELARSVRAHEKMFGTVRYC